MEKEICNFCKWLPDRVCARCECDLCDDCDKWDWKDQENLCPDCKGVNIEYNSTQNTKYWEQLNKDLLLIKENQEKILAYYESDISWKYMFLKKAFAVLVNLDWDLSTARTSWIEKHQIDMIRKEIDFIIDKSLRAIKENSFKKDLKKY